MLFQLLQSAVHFLVGLDLPVFILEGGQRHLFAALVLRPENLLDGVFLLLHLYTSLVEKSQMLPKPAQQRPIPHEVGQAVEPQQKIVLDAEDDVQHSSVQTEREAQPRTNFFETTNALQLDCLVDL